MNNTMQVPKMMTQLNFRDNASQDKSGGLNNTTTIINQNTNGSKPTYYKLYEASNTQCSEPKFIKQGLGGSHKDLHPYTKTTHTPYSMSNKIQNSKIEKDGFDLEFMDFKIEGKNKKTNNNRFKLENSTMGYKSNASTSLSQVSRKYNFPVTRKFEGGLSEKNSIGEKSKSHTFRFGRNPNLNTGSLRSVYDNFDAYMTNNMSHSTRQLPQIYKKNGYIGQSLLKKY